MAAFFCRNWLSEAPAPTIEQAAEITGMLADLPSKPGVFEALGQIWRPGL